MYELIFTWKGCSLAVRERARRLLHFELGQENTGAGITVATMFARRHKDPAAVAEHLIRIAPRDAVEYLAEEISAFLIDGEACPFPHSLARAALAHAGRAV
jgi:hypothetical protein